MRLRADVDVPRIDCTNQAGVAMPRPPPGARRNAAIGRWREVLAHPTDLLFQTRMR
jgi:hypothetical protein